MDATLTGIDGIWGSRVYSALVPPNLVHHVSITQVEMYNILVAVRLWPPLWKDKSIRIRCDNESAVWVCNTGKTRCTQREQNARLHITSLLSDIKYCKEDNKIKPNM